MEIYRLSNEYFKAAQLKGLFLERARKKRFRVISKTDSDGSVRVFELCSGYRSTYHRNFLATDAMAWQKLRGNIMAELEVDLTQKDGFTQARNLRVNKIMGHINAYQELLLGQRSSE